MEKAKQNIQCGYIHIADMMVICATQPSQRFGRFLLFLNKAIGAIGGVRQEEQYGDNESDKLSR